MDLNQVVWRKASRSTSNGGNCVEITSVPGTIAIRDSKNPNGPRLTINHNDFHHLIRIIKST
ncbi:uncharacterized protein DUF397 [Actinomadura pelletieri DSM 43383]|uniref:Uncharacterized protein DUF397 n=1 Tax=Actinomadura pelletieri DSM 43383 TaxID=1120940 RepID=A0A495QY35_9ACTN|nr:DUF397 domain-containing protein [Actinomadura pelletieri]RKS79030.1 uncharacterized protein DUF397 [Actinomadura pelletieri DSM 43383]